MVYISSYFHKKNIKEKKNFDGLVIVGFSNS